MKQALPARQRGMTLIVGLIMLILMLLMGVSTFNMTRSNTAMTANMQHKMETTNAAMQVTEAVISTTQFIDTPTNAVPNPCGGQNNRACIDLKGDGKYPVIVDMSPPPCAKKIQVIKNANLDLTNPDDVPCSLGVSQSLGVAGSTTGDSLCAASIWEITANAIDPVTEARSAVVTGVAVRVASDAAMDPSLYCP